MGKAARWAATLAATGAMLVAGAGVASAGDWEQSGYTGWSPWASSTYTTPAKATTTTPRFEDEPGWNCAEHGNKVCGPYTGPNRTDHNVYYGTGALPFIPGRVTTFADGTERGPRCVDPVFVELGQAPVGAVVGDCR